jgi:hypothetical protein
MKILIAYDGSECAESAIDDLKRAGLPLHAEALALTLVFVLSRSPDAFKQGGELRPRFYRSKLSMLKNPSPH